MYLKQLYHIPPSKSLCNYARKRRFAAVSRISFLISFSTFLSSVSAAFSLGAETTRYVTVPILCSVVVCMGVPINSLLLDCPIFFILWGNKIVLLQFIPVLSVVGFLMGSRTAWQLHGTCTPLILVSSRVIRVYHYTNMRVMAAAASTLPPAVR